ncbi:uncharacterized protein [Amphiura filiformis]|uniref:uncharacterized protein n=1 Tax=Amphiura filiformis TaxID=82378 RepID=UPI003B217634
MAAFAEAAEDELSCPVCFELFVDPNTPKILPACGHVCCEVCLKKMVAEQMAQTCPECRKEICLPKGGVTSLLTNFRLRNLAEKHGQEVPEPVNKQTCDMSAGQHKKKKKKKEKKKKVCLTLKHKGDEHVIEGVEEMHSKQKGQMQAAFEKVSNSMTEGEDALPQLAGLETKVHNPHAAVAKQIDECIEQHIKQLREQGSELKQLQQAADTKLVKADQGRLAGVKPKVESAKQSYQPRVVTSENHPDYEYIVQYTHLTAPLKRKYGFTPHAATKFAANNMNIGCKLPVTSDRTRKVKLIQTLHGFKAAGYVAHSFSGLLAVTEANSKKVHIYHKVNGKYKKKLKLKLENLDWLSQVSCSAAIHPDGRVMVVRLIYIEVYSPEGNYLNKIETVAPDDTPPVLFGITITSDGRILAGDIYRSVITEHDATGNIVRTIKTNICPWYMTLIHDSHIAMSDRKAGKVSVMDMETGQDTLRIDIPGVRGVSYDEQTKCLLIVRSEAADNNTGVIEQYSYTTGKLVACLEQGLRDPRGMTMTGDGNLAVAYEKTVNIYKLE